MGLTSPALAVLLAVLAAALLAGVLWRWPALAGSGVRMVATRAAVLGALELTVLGLIFVLVNRSNDFYSSWSDLFGTATGRGGVIIAGGRAARPAARPAAPPVTVTGSAAVRLKGRGASRNGQLQAVRFYGQLSGLTVPGYVYLPAGYYAARPAVQPLPVLVVISNQVSSQSGAYGARRIAALAAAQIAAGRLKPLLMVLLPATVGQVQGCLDAPGGAQAATFFSQDLPHLINADYQTVIPRTLRWALLGDSSGAYCALQLALTSPDVFSAAAAPPGVYRAPPGPQYGGSAQIRTQDNVLWMLQHQPQPPISVLLTGSSQAQPLLSAAHQPMRATLLRAAAGQQPLAAVLDWLGNRLRPPLQGPSGTGPRSKTGQGKLYAAD